MTSLENFQPSISRNWKDQRKKKKDIYGQFHMKPEAVPKAPAFTIPFAESIKGVAVTRCS